ncbi:haloalkane dehalogenase [Neolewinella agarilytica]|uniref:haloalkane dehalogenase n=1 Tax=Neolewinella agarilytica TaxID=478744 RepID=UPI002357D251|nr:haloalkane dehalogenase [Neolewinella agarilytica]
MHFLRTPDDRFKNLSDYNFAPNYVDVSHGLRMHYLDVNPGADQLIVCLHGEPSWSYLYRKMIPLLVAEGYRVIAPDLIGFGKSDKPVAESDYTYQRHVDWVRELLFDHLNLRNINLFIQDWGGLIGLRLLAEHTDRFKRIAAANTFMPTGDQNLGQGFEQWKAMTATMDPFPVGSLLQVGTVSQLSIQEMAAYDAPFPDETYKAGVRVFPSLVPSRPNDPATPANRAAWAKLRELQLPFLTLFSDSDPITIGVEKYFQKSIPGARGQPHLILKGGGHFLQEDCAREIVAALIPFFGGR